MNGGFHYILGSDPGVHINIYGSLSNYIIPGPPVFSCNGQQPPTQPTVQPTTQPPVTTQPPSGGGGSGAAQWAQCGGSGFSGPTTCQSPYTCVKVNDWVSICVRCISHSETLTCAFPGNSIASVNEQSAIVPIVVVPRLRLRQLVRIIPITNVMNMRLIQ